MSEPTEPKWTNRELKEIAEPLAKKLQDIVRKLGVIKGQSGWHAKQHATLTKRETAAKEDWGKLKGMANMKKGDRGNPVDPAKLATEVDAILTEVNAALAKKPKITYFYGTSSVANSSAIEAKAKAALPASDKKFASQAVHDAVTGTNPKDATVAGTGVKHASSGTPNVGSCTVFFTWDDHDDGLERRFTVLGVGGHAGASSYKIYESFTSKLKVGATVSL